MSEPLVALANVVRLCRPADLDGRVEIVIADPLPRAFPARVSSTLGVCLKMGPSHLVRADGRWREYPTDAICVRPPECIWSTENTGPSGFLSIDLSVAPGSADLDARPGRMEFVPAHVLPDLRVLAARLAGCGARLEKDESISELIVALASTELISSQASIDPVFAPRGLQRARDLLDASTEANPSLDEVAGVAGMNKHVLVRKFRERYGVTPHAYLVIAKIARAREMLARGWPVSSVAAALCFADQAHLSRSFRAKVGMTPRAYQRSVRALG